MNTNEIGCLPPGWVSTTLAEVVVLNPRAWNTPPTDADVVSFLPMTDVEAATGKMYPVQQRKWGDVKKGYTPFQEGDVLFAKITPCMENGKFAIAKNLVNGRAAGSTEFHVLRPGEAIHPIFLLHLLLRQAYRRDARMSMQGAAGQLRVPTSFLAGTCLLLPPLNEQHRIVAEIEKQFSRLDAGVTALKRVQTNLKRYRASVLRAACEGRLVPTEAELARQDGRDYEPAACLLERILAERRARWETEQLAKLEAQGRLPLNDTWKAKYQEPAAPDTSTLPKLPEGWGWASLEQMAWNSSYGTSVKCDYDATGFPVLRIPNVANGKIDVSDMKFATENITAASECLAPNDLLIIRTNGSKGLIGKGALVRTTFVQPHFFASYLIRYRLLPVDNLPAFVAMLWHTPFVRQWIEQNAATSAGQYNISMGALHGLSLPLPPFAEQERIVVEVERRLSIVDELEATVAANLKRAERLRQSVLQRAFAGKLVPQDPNDEPASVLLERIRAEREGKAAAEPKRKGGKRGSRDVHTPQLF